MIKLKNVSNAIKISVDANEEPLWMVEFFVPTVQNGM